MTGPNTDRTRSRSNNDSSSRRRRKTNLGIMSDMLGLDHEITGEWGATAPCHYTFWTMDMGNGNGGGTDSKYRQKYNLSNSYERLAFTHFNQFVTF